MESGRGLYDWNSLSLDGKLGSMKWALGYNSNLTALSLGWHNFKFLLGVDHQYFANTKESAMHSETFIFDLGGEKLGTSIQLDVRGTNAGTIGAKSGFFLFGKVRSTQLGLSTGIQLHEDAQITGWIGSYLAFPKIWFIDGPAIGFQEPFTYDAEQGFLEGSPKEGERAGITFYFPIKNSVIPSLAIEYNVESFVLFDSQFPATSKTILIKADFPF